MKNKLIYLILLIAVTLSFSSCKIETVKEHQNKTSIAQTTKNADKTKSDIETTQVTDVSNSANEQATTLKNENNIVNNVTQSSGLNSNNNTTTTLPKTTSTTVKNSVTTTAATTQKKTISVTVAIDCSEALGNKNLKPSINLPKDGSILKNTSITVNKNSSALDATKKVCSENDVFIYASGGYISTIGPISEKDCGPYSGWMYYVNGVKANVGSDDYVLENGDKITWKYVTEF